jgi:hypothetical protein
MIVSKQGKHLDMIEMRIYVRSIRIKKSPLGLNFISYVLLLAIRRTVDLLLFDEVPETKHFVPSFLRRTLEVLKE